MAKKSKQPPDKKWHVHLWEWFWEFVNAEKLGIYLRGEVATMKRAKFLLFILLSMFAMIGFYLRGVLISYQADSARTTTDNPKQDIHAFDATIALHLEEEAASAVSARRARNISGRTPKS